MCQPAGVISPFEEGSILAFSEKHAVDPRPGIEVLAPRCIPSHDERKERKRKKGEKPCI